MDLFDLYAKIVLDTGDYEQGLESASGKTSAFADKLKTGLATAAKVGAAALTATTAAVGVLTKAAVDNYAEYEQLVGGAQLMFGDAYDFVAENAANAFSTVQMSQNEYLQQVNGFATGLKTALYGNEQAAAELADRIITAEADIVAATGNSQEAVQNAFNGIMKSNYTMLDNLQIGITPTKEGFQEVIDKVNEWNAANGNATHYMIDNLADAQSALIDYIEMQGLAGYASAEAADTIQGSLSSAKAAWKNLVTGIADENADLETLIGNFVDSAETAAGNVIPRITQILSGMGTAIQQLAPVVASELPKMITSTLPDIVSAGAQLMVGLTTGLVGAIPGLLAAVPDIVESIKQTISDNQSAILEAGMTLLTFLGNGIMTGMPLLAETAASLMSKLGEYLKTNIPTFLQSGLEMLDAFTGSLRENAGVLVDAALELAKNLAYGLAASIPTIIEQVPGIVSNIANVINDNAPKMLAAAAEIIGQLAAGLVAAIPTLLSNIPQIAMAIWNVFTAVNWINLGANIIQGIGNGIKSMGSFAASSMETIKATLKDSVSKLPETFLQIGKNIIQGLINGVKSMASTAVQAVKNVGESIVSSITDFLGIHSPSTVFASIGKNMILGLDEGWNDNFDSVKKGIIDSLDFGTANVDFASSGLGMSSAGIINTVSAAGAANAGGIGNATFVLQLEDGTKIASWLLSDLIKAGDAAGTPIASGQYA